MPTHKRQKLQSESAPKHLIINAFDMMCPSLQTAGFMEASEG